MCPMIQQAMNTYPPARNSPSVEAKAKARRDKAAAAAAAKEDRVDRLCGAVEKLAEAVASKSGN